MSRLFVGSIHSDADPEELKEIFQRCGTVKAMELKDKNYGFIVRNCHYNLILKFYSLNILFLQS